MGSEGAPKTPIERHRHMTDDGITGATREGQGRALLMSLVIILMSFIPWGFGLAYGYRMGRHPAEWGALPAMLGVACLLLPILAMILTTLLVTRGGPLNSVYLLLGVWAWLAWFVLGVSGWLLSPDRYVDDNFSGFAAFAPIITWYAIPMWWLLASMTRWGADRWQERRLRERLHPGEGSVLAEELE